MKALLTTCTLLLILSFSVKAQTAEIRGSVFDEDNSPAEQADVLLKKNSEIVKSTTCNSEGYFEISGIYPGTYSLSIAYVGAVIHNEEVNLSSGEILTRYKIKNSSTDTMKEVIIRAQKTENVDVVQIDHIINFGPEVDQIPNIQINVSKENGIIQVGTGRFGGTKNFFGNNTTMLGQGPKTFIGLAGIEIIDRGVPARYGNFTGGGVQFKTAPIGVKPVNSFQIQSTSLTDKYHHNLGVMYIARALKTKSHMNENTSHVFKTTVLGYSFLLNYKFQADESPSKIKPFAVTEDYVGAYNQNPVVSSEVIGGYVPATTFLSPSDVSQVGSRPNAGRHDVTGRLKFTYNPTDKISIDFINNLDIMQRRIAQSNFVLLNSDENPEQKYSYLNSQIQLTHNVKSSYDANGKNLHTENDLISRMKYTVDLNFQQTNSTISNSRHGDNFFDYGYVGSFETIQVPTYTYVEDGVTTYTDANGEERILTNYVEFSGYRDSLVGYTPGDKNEQLASYSKFFFDKLNTERSIQEFVSSGGLLNGQNMPLLYSLYANPGTVYGNYNKSFQQRFSASVNSEFSLRPFKNNRNFRHDMEVGMAFQQDVSGSYGLNAANLWQLMPLLANSHIQNLDKNSPIISADDKGRFTDTVSYPVYVDINNQKNFDKKLRDKLMEMGYRDANGNLIDQESRIDIQSLSPEVFELSMFNADELLNNGNPYVSYSGYDYLGNRTRGKSGIQKFLTDKQNRPVDAFAPITASAWIQDRIDLKSMVIRAGLRFERYDGNQYVLKDPYSIYPTRQAGEVSSINGQDVNHPNGIGEDYVVYVDDINNPNEILGYRDGSTWYDADGNQLSDPNVLANKSSSGRIQPYLVDPENQELSANSFKKFDAQNLVLPRISISFPLNTSSLFFMSYDKLAQNPTVGQTYLPYTTYYYMQSNISGVLPNPELKARVKTEYNIGFSQSIGWYSSIKLWASYANVRNDFNQFRVEQAYPYSYTTYSNIDFSTIKRYVAEYSHVGRYINLTGSYALQFAEGTGSNSNSAATLIQSGQPNLRSLFPMSYDNRHTIKGGFVLKLGGDSSIRRDLAYRGPTVKGKRILKNVTISGNMQAISGRPYTSIQRAISEAQAANGVVQRAQTKGNPFGSRMPWTNNVDLTIEKRIMLNKSSIGVYVLVSNLLNTALIQNVYDYTGLANDDGYLNSPHGQQQAQGQIDAQTFEMLYRLRMDNPGNYGAPRMVNVGAKFNF